MYAPIFSEIWSGLLVLHSDRVCLCVSVHVAKYSAAFLIE